MTFSRDEEGPEIKGLNVANVCFKIEGMRSRRKPVRRVKLTPTSGEPFVVHPREVAKSFHGYDTDPEILLACMIVSGTFDTSQVCRTEIHLANGLPLTNEQSAADKAFRRVWSQPTEEETALVLDWAARIAGDLHKSFAWKKGRPH